MANIFTGIGSRRVGKEVGMAQQRVAYDLASEGYLFRSGKAGGSDTNFQEGYELARANGIECSAEIFLPTPRFNIQFGTKAWNVYVTDGEILKRAEKLAKSIHPDWSSCDTFARLAHTRNVFQIMGRDLRTYSKFVLYYAPVKDDIVFGGTATAVALADKLRIPSFNFYRNKASNLRAFLREVA